jgi:hypothetical protein
MAHRGSSKVGLLARVGAAIRGVLRITEENCAHRPGGSGKRWWRSSRFGRS